MKKHTFDKIDLLSFAAGDCHDVKQKSIRKHLAECESCRLYVEQIEKEKKDFMSNHLFESTINIPVKTNSKNKLFYVKKQYLSLAASLLLFLSAGYFLASRQNNDVTIRIKGETGIKVFVQNKNGEVEKRRESTYFTGEKIQFVYSCGNQNRFILLGIDSGGVITTYYPNNADSSIIIEKGQDIPLPNSIVLDDYTGKEIFWAVFSQKPLCVSELKKQLGNAYVVHNNIESLQFEHNAAVIVRYDCTIRAGGTQ